jgi:hypothetical protein
MATQSEAASERVAIRAALLPNGSCLAVGAFVHGVLGELPSTLHFGAQLRDVQSRRLVVAQSIRVLLACACAVTLLRCAQRGSTDQAGW